MCVMAPQNDGAAPVERLGPLFLCESHTVQRFADIPFLKSVPDGAGLEERCPGVKWVVLEACRGCF